MIKNLVFGISLLVISSAPFAQSCNRSHPDDGNYVQPWEFCDDDFSHRKVPQFNAFPAEPAASFTPVLPQRRAGPDVQDDMEWLEVIKEEYQSQTARFAGNYLFVQRGQCGGGCNRSLIVDQRNGRVYKPGEIGIVLANLNPLPPTLCKTLGIDCINDTFTFRKESKMLVVVGALGESAKKRGIYHFQWDDNTLKLISKVEKSPHHKPGKRKR